MSLFPLHGEAFAHGRWRSLSLMEQLGNVGSEVGRSFLAQEQKNDSRMNAAIDRALELFDMTIADPKNRHRLKEICRAREVYCDYFFGGNQFGTDPQWLDQYFMDFALAVRR